MTGLEFVEWLRMRMELAMENAAAAGGEVEWAYWDGKAAAMRDVLAMIEVQVEAEARRRLHGATAEVVDGDTV